MIRVLVVEDHKRMRARLRALLDTADDIQVADVAANGAEAIAVASHTHPQVVLLVASLPAMDSVQTTRGLVEQVPGCRWCCWPAPPTSNYCWTPSMRAWSATCRFAPPQTT
jgi:two-component system, NarL family, response regulator LiaR